MTQRFLPGQPGYLKYSLLLLLLLLLPIYSAAEVVPDIYKAQIPVMDESEAERARAINTGLAQVVVKATGRPRAMAASGVAELLASARRYVGEYHYVYPQGAGAVPITGAVPMLHVQYLQADLERALRVLQLPVWPADRPLLLLWVTETSNGSSRLINTDEPAYRALAAVLARRGMPVELPLLDLQDQINLGDIQIDADIDADSKAETETQFALASARYPVKHWLHVNYQPSDGLVRGNWNLAGEGVNADEPVQASSLTGFMVDSADRVVEHFSGNSAYAPAESTRVLHLMVDNVLAYEDYQQVVAILKALELVRDVQVSALQGPELSLSLQLEGEAQRLFEALDKDGRFIYVAQVGASMDKARRYSWGGQ
ncbi:MAG: DUF2066 domain-containing protein [Porticoccaceae bacterium]|nr:DUF2066 domain-containing protein [Porticoccaceae bacterium]